MDAETRLLQIKQLSEFRKLAEDRLGALLSSLEWTIEGVLKKETDVVQLTPKKCNLIEEPALPESFNTNPKTTVILDKNEQALILLEAFNKNPQMRLGVPLDKIHLRDVPQTAEDLVVNFTCDEKLALYEHAIEKTGRISEPEIKISIHEPESTRSEMTFAEIVAFKRNLKRRKMKYKTTKEPPMSRVEEMRRLIGIQMDAWSQYVKGGRSSSNDGRKRSRSRRRHDSDEEYNTNRSHCTNFEEENASSQRHYRKMEEGRDFSRKSRKPDVSSSRKNDRNDSEEKSSRKRHRSNSNSSKRHHHDYRETSKNSKSFNPEKNYEQYKGQTISSRKDCQSNPEKRRNDEYHFKYKHRRSRSRLNRRSKSHSKNDIRYEKDDSKSVKGNRSLQDASRRDKSKSSKRKRSPSLDNRPNAEIKTESVDVLSMEKKRIEYELKLISVKEEVGRFFSQENATDFVKSIKKEKVEQSPYKNGDECSRNRKRRDSEKYRDRKHKKRSRSKEKHRKRH